MSKSKLFSFYSFGLLKVSSKFQWAFSISFEMSILSMVQLALFVSYIIAVTSLNISLQMNGSLLQDTEFPGGEPTTIHSLRVSSTHFEPFMYQDEKTGQFYDGIEYKLLTTIAKREHLNLVFQNALDADKNDHLIHGFVLRTFFELFRSNLYSTIY